MKKKGREVGSSYLEPQPPALSDHIEQPERANHGQKVTEERVSGRLDQEHVEGQDGVVHSSSRGDKGVGSGVG